MSIHTHRHCRNTREERVLNNSVAEKPHRFTGLPACRFTEGITIRHTIPIIGSIRNTKHESLRIEIRARRVKGYECNCAPESG